MYDLCMEYVCSIYMDYACIKYIMDYVLTMYGDVCCILWLYYDYVGTVIAMCAVYIMDYVWVYVRTNVLKMYMYAICMDYIWTRYRPCVQYLHTIIALYCVDYASGYVWILHQWRNQGG
jgi:hypothetical protein